MAAAAVAASADAARRVASRHGEVAADGAPQSVRAGVAAQAARAALRLQRQRPGAGGARHGVPAVPGRRQVLEGPLQRNDPLERPDRDPVRSGAAERPVDRPTAQRGGRVRVRRAVRARSPLRDREAGARDRLRADSGRRLRGEHYDHRRAGAEVVRREPRPVPAAGDGGPAVPRAHARAGGEQHRGHRAGTQGVLRAGQGSLHVAGAAAWPAHPAHRRRRRG